jgi:GNAT superfamily N-acetyltransferase
VRQAFPEHVVIHYLAMDDRSELREKADDGSLDIRECEEKLWRYNRFLYELVGRHWAWEDKLKWTDQQWKTYAEAAELSTHVAYVRGTPAGYFELQEQADRVYELAYFGLVQRFIGRGLGGILLSRALATAWDLGASRIWLHTCSLDHPHALNNYLARGMKLTRSETVPAVQNP